MRGFGDAVVGATRTLPTVVGIDLGAAGAAGEPSGLTSSIRIGFEESSGGHGALAARSFVVFMLLNTPCVAAVGAIRHEVGTRSMWTSIIGTLLTA